MSAFGYTPKDDVVEAIETLAKAEHDRGKTPREIVESVLEASMCGLDRALADMNKLPVG
jgi:undecaprenyl pyrophosphate synthase